MKNIKPSEMKKVLTSLLFFTAFACAAGFFLGMASGILAFICCIVPTAVFLVYEKKRYSQIEQLTASIDSVLHGNDKATIAECIEGEPYILKSEIQKMLIKLHEQNDELKKNKIFLSDSIADISHQLRTPLTSINLIVTLLKAPDITKEKQSQLVSELSMLLSRIDQLITVLLKLSKLDAGTIIFEKQEISTKKLIQKASEPLEIPIELKGQKLSINTGEEYFFGDLSWLTEAIGNIIKNCYEHTQEGGTITISSNQTPIFTQIEISDNGPGIDSEDLPHIFERFYKGKHSSNSSFGIGLALSQSIISGHDGIIRARNGANGGAVFTIRFYHTVI